MSEQSERIKVASDALVDLFRRLLGLHPCIGNRWKCDNGHEWVTAHCDTTWFCMPTTCPECGQTATAHRGEWQTLEQWSNCTLIELKRALRDNATGGTMDNTADRGYETLAAIYKRNAVAFDSCLRILQQARDTLTGAGTDSLHAQADVDISGTAGSVKK